MLDLLKIVEHRIFNARYTTIYSKILKLEHLWVIYPGNREYGLHEKITALPLRQVHTVNTGSVHREQV